MNFTRYIWLVFALLILQSNSCNQNFKKDVLSDDEIWWNGLNEYWKELMLRETDHLDDKMNNKILQEILLLKQLSADHYPIYDLKPVEKLIHLESLSAGSTQITDLKPIENLKNLKSISFPDTPINDLTPLKNLTQLEEIYIQQTFVSDLDPISGAAKLQVLVAHATEVKSLKAIMHLKELSILEIGTLNIPQKEIDEFAETHPECEINK